ncbi:MAG: hypothetical protein OXU67_13100 [Chloroflexota bacterium]|nr:hypothetical protein [Chloroflexota bacterium]
MTVRYGLAGAALDSGTALVVDGCGCPWLQWGALPFPWPGRYGCGQPASVAAG